MCILEQYINTPLVTGKKPLHVTRPVFHHFYLKMDPAQNGEGG